MTGQQLTDRLLKRLGEDPALPRFFRQADALAAINEAQQLFVLLTLCLEAEVALTLSSGAFEYDASSTAADWLVCLSVRRADGVKVQPSTLGEMAALNPNWQATTAGSAPNRYAVAGFSTLYFTPQITATVTATYARGPVALTLVGNAEIPEEYQPCLLDYAQVRLRLHQGAQLLAADVALLKQFFDQATKCAAYVRTRSLDMRYDVLPPELKLPDFSRVLRPGLRSQGDTLPR